MKRYLVVAGLLLVFSSAASAAWTWEDSDNVDDSGLFDQIKNANDASDYCPDASSDNQEEYCVEIEGWDSVSLEGNDGLDNIFTIYREISDSGDLENDELDNLLTMYRCYNDESNIETAGECISDEGLDVESFGAMNPAELRLIEGSNNDGQDKESDEDDGESDPSDGEDEQSDENPDFTSGEFSFFDTEAGDSGSTRVSTENSNFQYDMYDGDIVGRMRYQNVDGGLHTFWVKNEHTGESDREFGNSDYLSIPQDGEETWGTEESGPEESGLYEMDDTGCTDFQVAVLPDQTSELDEALQGPETFTFCPGDGRSDDDTESAPSKTSGDYTFRLSPRPQDITTGTDVTLEAEGDLEDKRVRLELDGIAGYVPNDPERYRECTGSPCSITIEEDRIEGEPNTVRGQVRSYDPINLWEDESKVSWSID